MESRYLKIADTICVRIRPGDEKTKIDFFCTDNSEEEPGSLLHMIKNTRIDEAAFREAYKTNKKQTIFHNEYFKINILPKIDKKDKALSTLALTIAGCGTGLGAGIITISVLSALTNNPVTAAAAVSAWTLIGTAAGIYRGLKTGYTNYGKYNHAKKILSYTGDLNSGDKAIDLSIKQLDKLSGIVQMELNHTSMAYRFLDKFRYVNDIPIFIRNSWARGIDPAFDKGKIL